VKIEYRVDKRSFTLCKKKRKTFEENHAKKIEKNLRKNWQKGIKTELVVAKITSIVEKKN
jgi:hypothetical protein